VYVTILTEESMLAVSVVSVRRLQSSFINFVLHLFTQYLYIYSSRCV